MKITTRQVVNLVAVVLVGGLATFWALVSLVGVDPFREAPIHLTVQLAESGGALPGAEVTYLGVGVGTVADARVTAEHAELDLEVRLPDRVGAELRADVRQKTSLGEPYVDLSPVGDGLRPGAALDGAVITQDRTSTPPALAELLRDGDELFSAIPLEELDAVTEAVSGLAGREDELRRIVAGAAAFGEAFGDRETVTGLLRDGARLSETLRDHRAALDAALRDTADLTGVLVSHRDDLDRIILSAADLGEVGARLLRRLEPDLDGALDGLETSVRTLAERPTKVHDILRITPKFVTRIGQTFDDNAAWSSTQGVPGAYLPTYGLPVTGQGLRIDKVYVPPPIRRIELEGRGWDQAMLLLAPEDARRATSGPDAWAAVRDDILRDLAEGCARDPAPGRCPQP